MFVHVHVHVETLTEYASGAVIRPVTCERCSGEYFYELARVAKGTGNSVYGIGKEAARKRARKAAEKKLAAMLAKDVEAVPCPSCGWAQAAMARDVCRRRLRWIRWVGYACHVMALTIVACGIAMSFSDQRMTEWMVRHLLTPTMGLAAFGVVLLAMQRTMVRSANLLRSRQPATPPAMTRDSDGIFCVTEQEQCNVDGRAGVVVIQVSRCSVPQRCCSCLGPAEKWNKPAMCDTGLLAIPTCKACSRAGNWAVARMAVLVVTISATLAWFGSTFFSNLKPVERYTVATFAAVGLMIVLGLLCLLRAPMTYRGKMIDRRRGVVKLTFQNERYAQILAEGYRFRSPNPALPIEAAHVR